jgi:hypothetical protein
MKIPSGPARTVCNLLQRTIGPGHAERYVALAQTHFLVRFLAQ